MRYIIFTLISLIYFCKSFSQCNPEDRELIHNAGFEDGDNSYPTDIHQFEYVSVWEQDMAKRTFEGETYYYHSPEWFKCQNLRYPLTEPQARGELHSPCFLIE
jgi:hypothetical protein